MQNKKLKNISLNNETNPALLRALKDAHGLTWKQVAEALQVSQSWLENWMSGNRKIPPYLATLAAIYLDNPHIFKKFGLLANTDK